MTVVTARPQATQMSAPLVSICIPTYNGAPWIEDALASALAQDYEPLEVVVCDDGSQDATLEIVARAADPRVRVIRNATNLGLAGNWNRTTAHARGELIKYLFQDDLLYSGCVARMAALFRDNPRLGLVFSPRDVLLDQPETEQARSWKATYGVLHHHFEGLQRVNVGRGLFEQWLHAGFRENWVGEPSCVMLRRRCVEEVGGFNERMWQGTDFEMWIRLMYFYDVGFIPEALSAFRYHPSSTTVSNHHANRPWLDMLWLLEGLLEHPEIRASHPRLRRMLFVEGLRAVHTTLWRIRRRVPVAPAYQCRTGFGYLGYRIRSLFRVAPPLHGAFGP